MSKTTAAASFLTTVAANDAVASRGVIDEVSMSTYLACC
jgi:hypothetical protein